MPVIGAGTAPCFEDPTPTVYLDTETTGKFLDDQIIEIAIIDDNGTELLDTLVHTKHPISREAFRTHGILKKKLKKKPTLAKLQEKIVGHIAGKHLVMFNAPFDCRYLTETIKKAPARISCCQREHSKYHGKKHNEPEPCDRHSLQFACKEIGYIWVGTPHRAKPDALACRAVWQHMRGQSGKKILDEQEQKPDDALGHIQQKATPKPVIKNVRPTVARAAASVSVASPAPRPACQANAREPERVFLDIGTTGLDTNKDEIVQIAVLGENGVVILNEHVMPKAPGPIPDGALRVHGLTKEDLKKKKVKPIERVIPKIIRAIKDKLVVTYKDFDRKMLPDECREAAADFCDCFACFSKINPHVRGPGKRTLEAACAYCGRPVHRGLHDATEDSELCRFVCENLKKVRRGPCPQR